MAVRGGDFSTGMSKFKLCVLPSNPTGRLMNSATSFDDCAVAYWKAGYPISRAPLDFQEKAMARLEPFPEVCAAIKRALALNGILSPGHYGIG
jgi:hypothetical protein